MERTSDFFTMKGYQLTEGDRMTTAMEDYLEMIARMLQKESVVRVNALALNLNVKPSSASKMVKELKENGYLYFKKYGTILLTEKGECMGAYLLYRHDVLHDFLCKLNHSPCELEQVEKIEHFINRNTVENMALLAANLPDAVIEPAE